MYLTDTKVFSHFHLSRLRGGMGLSLLILFSMLLPSHKLQAQQISHKAQSLFIYKFTRYVSWPPTAINGKIVIGIYGNSPIVDELRLMSSLKTSTSGLPIEVKVIQSIEEMENIHILYLASSKSRELSTILKKINKKATLVVAERGGLAKKGACINFILLENDVLRFEVNKAALEQHQLDMSEELLKLGFEVG